MSITIENTFILLSNNSTPENKKQKYQFIVAFFCSGQELEIK